MNSQLKGKRIRVVDDLTVGSGEGCKIRAKHAELDDTHARFFATEGAIEVEVGNDNAHIFVNGRDVLRSELQHNDTVTVGPLRFKVIDQRAQRQATNRLDELLSNVDGDDEGPGEIYNFATEDLFYLTTKDPALRNRISFSIPSRDRFIDQAQQFLARLIRQSGMDEMKVEAFMTCTKELILNAHRHGHAYDESKAITIHYRDEGPTVSLQICDEGTGFDHKSIIDKVRGLSAAEAARQRYQSGGFGGLGFQMITRMADELEYNEPGNEVYFKVSKEF
ncbi:MAG: ATP-binding protein [Planctomycetota bacterium]|nr:ATP-binding protein [Planctomycetota bacterium]